MGSPPHMRGKVWPGVCALIIGRITPAHAGKRVAHINSAAQLQDHPRTCGEKHTVLNIKIDRIGSPPHMRGKGSAKAMGIKTIRITPAHAGKSP